VFLIPPNGLSSRILALLVATILTACTAPQAPTPPPPLYEGLGETGRDVTTDVDLAQTYFDQGLALSWGFNHDEALRSFEEAARLDPDCAMALWGQAYVLGPNLNRPMEDDDVARSAHEASTQALSTADGASDVERALIEALAQRYADPPPEDRSELNLAYANAMREVWKRFPDDPVVGVLFADALMNINLDWRAWGTDEERGEYTPEIVETLERVLEIAPDHAGANHFYIHAVEGSDRPDRALPSAERLGSLMPAAGHMVHMPSHIYIRLGMYDAAVASNARAVTEDDRFFADAPRSGVYHLYRAHNHHFLSWAAMFRGSRADAMETAQAMVAKLPESYEDYPGIDTYRFVPMHVMMRFGEWEAMLAEPAPDDEHVITTALWHHARAVAFSNTDRFEEARREAELFDEAAEQIEDDTKVRRARIDTLLEAARHMMWGEILFREGDHEAGLASLREGVEIEDSLPYAEPPGWMQPIRHSLGALLLESGLLEDAEQVYRADLGRHADNVWSLHGLEECLRKTGREEEARAVQARFDEVSRLADVEIKASCFCRRIEG
jgi:tetratricopeptide (TPR) repeat protein